MYAIELNEETKKFLREIRKELKKKDYKQAKSKTNRKIGSMILDYTTEYYIKGKMIFEIELNNGEKSIYTRFKFGDEYKEIRLADLLSLA